MMFPSCAFPLPSPSSAGNISAPAHDHSSHLRTQLDFPAKEAKAMANKALDLSAEFLSLSKDPGPFRAARILPVYQVSCSLARQVFQPVELPARLPER